MKSVSLVVLGVFSLGCSFAQEVQRITITGSAAPRAPSIAGFDDATPLSKAPFSATVIDQGTLRDAGISSLGDITRLDAGITDAYNAPGYWNQLAVRGYTLDNRYNYRRDGLPINAETVFGPANKQRLEVLKGTSGLQAGTSAPGGLLNLVVKRPRERVREASLGFTQDGTLEAAFDVGQRSAGGIGWRVNLDAARLDPQTRSSRGERWLGAAAFDMRLGSATLVEAEIEASRQSQPSTPGLSLLGARLPDAEDIDPRLNLNNQPWSLPVVMAGRTGSLRVTHTLQEGEAQNIDLVVHAMRQRLDNDDRIAFPFGCSAENAFDRYCSDGSFDYYDFRSDGERRTSDALDIALKGRARLGSTTHHFNAGVLFTRHAARFNRQAFNFVGGGSIGGGSVVPSDPTLTDENTNRDERSTELHLQDMLALSQRWSLWAGLRHTRLERDSVRTDGSRATSYDQSFTTPWLALSHALSAQTQLYASAGQGIESEVAPNRLRYVNAGQALPALKSRQLELGAKHAGDRLDWRIAVFDTRRPVAADFHADDGAPAFDCSDADPCLRRSDGIARHRGIEAEAEWRVGAFSLRGSALLLRARRSGSDNAAINGLQPTNVPTRSLKLQAAHNVAAVPGLALVGFVTHEGRRRVLPDNSVSTPGWTRIDLAARFTQQLDAQQTLVWRLGIDNLTDRRAWQEAPFQFGHAYLYPLAPRTLQASLTAAW
jgi:iron complex outermembrane receptor protein